MSSQPNATDPQQWTEDAWKVWEALQQEERLEIITTRFAPTEWYGPQAWPVVRETAGIGGALWGQVKAQYKALGGNPYDLQKAVDVEEHAPDAGQPALPPKRHVPALGSCPALPASAICPHPSATACPWLDEYVRYSQRWSPRGLRRAHHAVGLWVLSTVAARRITCELGALPTIPALSMAMVAPSTLYAKSTTASLGIDLLTRAGLRCLLAADRTTPQALLRSMAGHVPTGYGRLPADKQERWQARLAFAGQRGTYMEEWGGMLSEMSRKDSAMAAFHSLLRILDDGQTDFENDTILRGLEELDHPYLAVLASATPYDLAPYVAEGSKWWHDGFWARFAFIAPYDDEQPSLAHPPRGARTIPGDLLWPLAQWHQRLGVPTLSLTEILDNRDKPTGAWQAEIGPLPQHTLRVDADVADQHDLYNDTLLGLVMSGDVPQDFSATYGRFHAKALRIALVMASLAGDETVRWEHWCYAQALTEDWRLSLHELYARVTDSEPLSRGELIEQKLLKYLAKAGQATAREIAKYCHSKDSVSLARTLAALTETGQVFADVTNKTTRYGLVPAVKDDNDTLSVEEAPPW